MTMHLAIWKQYFSPLQNRFLLRTETFFKQKYLANYIQKEDPFPITVFRKKFSESVSVSIGYLVSLPLILTFI